MPYRHSVSVAGAVYDCARNAFLVIERADNGKWELPGGILEEHETVLDGLRREVEEETGVLVEPLWLSGVYKNMTLGVVALVFRCEVKSGSPHTTDESRNVRWMTSGEVEEMMSPAFAIRLLDARGDEHVVIRQHDGNNLL